MKITLEARMFNEIMAFASKFISKDDIRPVLSQILLEVEDGKLTITALDGYKLGQLTFFNNDWEDGEMIIPHTKRVKVRIEPYVTIIDDGKNIIFETAIGSQSYKKFTGEFFEYEQAFPKEEPKVVFTMTAGNIAKALSAFDENAFIDIEYYGKYLPLIVKDRKKATALILPARRNK